MKGETNLLNVVAGGESEETGVGCESNEIRLQSVISCCYYYDWERGIGAYRPLRGVEMLHQRRIGRHLDHITIALHTNHEHGLGHGADECCPPVCGAGVRRCAGVLADKDAVVAVVVVVCVEESDKLVGAEVVVDVDPHAGELRAWQALVGAGDDDDVRVLCLDGVVEGGEAGSVTSETALKEVFVADLDVG